MKSMTTDKAGNVLAPLTLALAIGQALPPDTQMWFVPLVISLIALVFWAMRGSGLTYEEGEELKEKVASLEDVLKEGRDE